MGYAISPQEIEEMKEFLRRHPVDPEYDEIAYSLDGVLPESEEEARACSRILKELGEID